MRNAGILKTVKTNVISPKSWNGRMEEKKRSHIPSILGYRDRRSRRDQMVKP